MFTRFKANYLWRANTKFVCRRVSQFHKFNLVHRGQAERTVLIKFRGEFTNAVSQDILSNCAKFGKVVSVCFIPNPDTPVTIESKAVLVEFKDRESVNHIHNHCGFFKEHVGFEVPTRQLYYRVGKQYSKKMHSVLKDDHMSSEELETQLQLALSLSHQMELLHQNSKLGEVALRMRYFICSDIEQSLSQMFSPCYVLPFGSTNNGFGKQWGDLDMVLLHSRQSSSRDCDYMYLSKGGSSDVRSTTQKTLSLVSSVINTLLPGYGLVENIPRARVPIIKFTHQALGVECDLSVEHRDSLPMSELLYNLSVSESRLPQLVYTLRRWGVTHEVINNMGTSHKLSTFMLIMLSIHFLQTQQILPKLSTMVSFNSKLEPAISALGLKTQNTEESGVLLQKFFKYYTDFNFDEYGIDVFNGKVVKKPSLDERPMYLVNPIVHTHNVCQNMLQRELDQFQSSCMDAHKRLCEDKNPSKTEKWGVLNILDVNVENKFTRERNSQNHQDQLKVQTKSI